MFYREVPRSSADSKFRNLRVAEPWDEIPVGDGTVTVVPSLLFGGRPPFSPRAEYQGYVISGEKCVYFIGNAGFDEKIFTDIRKIFALAIAFPPIGAYHPPSFRKHHMNPEDVIEAFQDPWSHNDADPLRDIPLVP